MSELNTTCFDCDHALMVGKRKVCEMTMAGETGPKIEFTNPACPQFRPNPRRQPCATCEHNDPWDYCAKLSKATTKTDIGCEHWTPNAAPHAEATEGRR